MQESIIYVQVPSDKGIILSLLNNVPVSVLIADVAAVKWLDEVKKAVNHLKL